MIVKRLWWRVAAALGVALLAGCATMTPNECKVANWAEVGLRDGLAGEPLSVLNDRVRDCAEAKVAVDTPRYLQGRDQGLVSYCRLDNAVRVALDGKSYRGVCPVTVDGEFRRRFNVAREVHQARGDLRTLEARRTTLESRLRDAKTDEERRRIRDELTDLDRDMRRARDRLRDAEGNLDRMRWR
jgi:Protein of unknown function (DUF2799)